MKQKVLFLCTHNSARSQMAEGLLRGLAGDSFEVESAGSVATGVREEAVSVMNEIGIDISGHESKTLDRFLHQPFDLVVTVCDHARDTCPTFPSAARKLHWSIPDPTARPVSPGSAGSARSDIDRRAAFRAARDDLERRIREEICEPATDPEETQHFRNLERMYLSAPINACYRPQILVDKGMARVTIAVRPEFFHAGGGVHGAVYFKALDDACFFAASSVMPGFMILTTQFNLQLVGQISAGTLRAAGRVVHAGKSSLLAEGVLHDDAGGLLARGQGTFVKSARPLDARIGYVAP